MNHRVMRFFATVGMNSALCFAALMLALLFYPPASSAASCSGPSAQNSWQLYSGGYYSYPCTYPFFSSPDEAAGVEIAQLNAATGNNYYLDFSTTYTSGGVFHSYMGLYYNDHGTIRSTTLDVEYTYSGTMGILCTGGSYAPPGQTCVGKSLGRPTPFELAICPCISKVADPIDVASGNVFEEAVDYETTGQNQLRFVRSYNSRAGFSSPATEFGLGWRSNFDRYIIILSSSSAIAERADGNRITFTLSGSTWTSDSDEDVTLTNSGSAWTFTDHDDTVETYTTNAIGNMAVLNTIQARNGYTQTLGYSSGLLATVTDSYSRNLTLTYSGTYVSSITTPDSTTINYGFTTIATNPTLTTVTYPTSPTSSVTYGYANTSVPTALTSVTDENGNTFATWTYDNFSRGLTNYMGASSIGANSTTLTYNDTTGTRTVTNALGVTDTYTFSVLQNVPKMTQISRASTSTTAAATRNFTYDSNGFVATTTDWNGNQTNYTNDSHGDPTSITEAAGTGVARNTAITYDPTFVHLPHQIVTPGLTSAFIYDSTGELLTRTDSDTTTTSVPYSTGGQTRTWAYTYTNYLLTSVQKPRTDVTAKTTFGYASDGGLISITDTLSHVTNITSHTTGGRPLTIVDPNGSTNGSTTTLGYDARQRLTKKVVSANSTNLTTNYTLDPVGELTKVTFPDSSYLSYASDTAHRVTQVTNALGDYLKYTLDALGDPAQSNIYASGGTLWRPHSATFDALGRMLTDVGGVGQTTTYSYDPNGNALTIKDGLNNQTSRVFDALNRLTTVTDANTPSHGVTQMAYDAHDRTLSVTDANANVTNYVYNGFGDAIQLASPDSGTSVYVYDPDSNLTQKTDALSIVTTHDYDALDRIRHNYYPSDSTQNVTYSYDTVGGLFGASIGRLSGYGDKAGYVNIYHDGFGRIGDTARYTSGGTNLNAIYYAYDSGGRMKGYTAYPTGLYVGYSFDAAGQVGQVQILPQGTSSPQTVQYLANAPFFGPVRYETFGNNVSVNLNVDQDYRINKFEVIATAGDLTNRTYTYDAANNLTGVSDTISAANNQTLGYDAFGNMIEENNSGVVTDYVYLNGAPIGIYIPGNSPPTTAKLYYIHADRLNTPQLVTDSTQAVVWSTTYQPYGTNTFPAGTITQNVRLPGQYADAETGFNYNGFRDYMPNLGRYLESDPIGLDGGLNTYAYLSENPYGGSDPMGLQEITNRNQSAVDLVNAYDLPSAQQSSATADKCDKPLANYNTATRKLQTLGRAAHAGAFEILQPPPTSLEEGVISLETSTIEITHEKLNESKRKPVTAKQ